MRILKNKKDVNAFLKLLRERASGGSPEIEHKVRAILEDVRINGNKALLKYTKAFDSLTTKSLRMTPAEIKKHSKAEKNVVDALKISAKRIRAFHERQKERSWSFSDKGNLLGQVIRPLERVGVYVPGGKASYPSTVLMNVIPAQVAGVKEIALCVPTPKGEIDPYVMAAIDLLSIKEVYRAGGAQAIGAMAYGTETIKKVDKIVGPGNIYVTLSKKMVFGEVDIDMLAGPSEILIWADEKANPRYLACDLLSQAEHDAKASAILITTSALLVEKVKKEIEGELKNSVRKEIIQESLEKNGKLIIAEDVTMILKFINCFGPEHLELQIENPWEMLGGIKNAGAIFMGAFAPEPLGDYWAGPNHIIPTSGGARCFSPLSVNNFTKMSSIIFYDKEKLGQDSQKIVSLARLEGL